MSFLSIDFGGISSQSATPSVPVFHGPIDNNSAPSLPCCFLHIQDGLLTKEDQKLPLARHVVSTLEHFHFVEDFVFLVFVRAKEVVVSDPEGQVIVGAVDVIKTVCMAVRNLKG